MRKALSIVVFFSLLISLPIALSQTGASEAAPSKSPASGTAPDTKSATAWQPSVEDLLPEVQKSVGHHGYVAILWWMPAEYFEASGHARADAFQAFRNNTVVAVIFGKVQPFGIMDFVAVDKIRPAVTMLDSKGIEYKPSEKIADDVRVPLEMFKPMFSASLGKMGENIQFLVFPGKDSSGNRIADPRAARDFSLHVKELTGEADTVVTWRLPLSGLFPPKYCPVGKEKVEASWKFCPWHGVALSQSQ